MITGATPDSTTERLPVKFTEFATTVATMFDVVTLDAGPTLKAAVAGAGAPAMDSSMWRSAGPRDIRFVRRATLIVPLQNLSVAQYDWCMGFEFIDLIFCIPQTITLVRTGLNNLFHNPALQ